jgi:IS5 family transposase
MRVRQQPRSCKTRRGSGGIKAIRVRPLSFTRAPNAKDFTNRRYRYSGRINGVEKAKNRTKSRVRATVEHVFKNHFGFHQTRYRGLAKNLHRL